MAEDTQQLTMQTGLLTQIAEDIRKLNVVSSTTPQVQSEGFDELQDAIQSSDANQTKQQQENARQEKTRSFVERLTQSKTAGMFKEGFSNLGAKIVGVGLLFKGFFKGTVMNTLRTFGLAQITLIAFLTSAIAFLNSSLWTSTKDFLAEQLPKAINLFIDFMKDVGTAFKKTNENIKTFLDSPTFKNFGNIFSDTGDIVLALAALVALFAPFKTATFLVSKVYGAAVGFALLFTKGGLIRKGIDKLFGKADISKDVDNLTKKGGAFQKFKDMFGKDGKLAKNILKIGTKITGAAAALGTALGLVDSPADASKKAAGIKTKNPNFVSKAFQGAKFVKGVPLVGAIVTAGFAIFDTIVAGLEEGKKQFDDANNENSFLRRSIETFKASIAGLLNSLTFGFLDITKEDFNIDMTKVPEEFGGTGSSLFSFNPTAGMSQQRIQNLISGPIDDNDLSTLKNLIKREDIQSEQRFKELKRELENAVNMLELRQRLVDEGTMQTNAAAFTVDAKQSTVNNTTHTNKPIVGMDFLTSMAVAARSQ